MPDDNGVADVRQPPQGRFDFAGLDPIAADLDLIVHAAKELDVSVAPIAAQVAGSVVSIIGIVAEGVAHEAFDCQVRTVAIPSRHAAPSDAYLAWHTHGNRPRMRVEDVDADISNRTPDRNNALR